MAKKNRTRGARQRRQKQRRRNQRRLLLAVAVIVAVLAAAMLAVSSQPVDVFIPSGLETRYDDLPRSLSIDGYPQLGDQEAPVTVEEYASFACPGCEVFHSESLDAILERVRSGQILFTYVPLQTGSIPNAPGAARTALCAGQQGMFWEMHDVLFAWHTRYANTAFSQNRLLAGVNALGLNSNTFTSCFNSASVSNALTAAQNEGVASTPTIQVNGVSVAASQAGAIPSTADVLQAIDNATLDDWRPTTAGESPAPQSETDEPPQTSAAAAAEVETPPETEGSEAAETTEN